jgi:hypothetical protein
VGKHESEFAMPTARDVRTIGGFLSARANQLRLDRVSDRRDPRGKRWQLTTLLWTSLLGMMTGQKCFADVERLTADLSMPVRRRFGIRRRISDTTLRDALATITPADLRPTLHSVTRSAARSKSVAVDFDLPFGVVSMDGKYVTVPSVDDQYAQRSTRAEGDCGITGRIGTMTATLCSSEARPCIDVYLIPASTNEMGVFPRALDALLEAYGNLDLFRLVTYDAGACSKANADHIRSRNLHYLFGLKGSQPQLLYWAQLSFKDRCVDSPDALTVDGKGSGQVTRSIFLLPCPDGTDEWSHLRTIVRVDSSGFDQRGRPTNETRYFLSSLPTKRLSAQQWLTVIRRHWSVETTHQILDVTFEEDEHPWVLQNPRLTATIMVLRRIGYSLLTIFRSVTQRSNHRRHEPWHVLLTRIRDALLLATPAALAGVRTRTPEPFLC